MQVSHVPTSDRALAVKLGMGNQQRLTGQAAQGAARQCQWSKDTILL